MMRDHRPLQRVPCAPARKRMLATAMCVGVTLFVFASACSAANLLFVVSAPSMSHRSTSTHRRTFQRPYRTVARCAGAGGGEDLSTSVRWLPPLQSDFHGSTLDEPAADVLILPLFPLQAGYLPHTNATLTIFEPRYREMYNDILFSGSRRFVVTAVDEETGRFAETGVVFYLDDLKEISEQTQDQYKYVCTHKVIGRVRLGRIVNPSSWSDRSTYMKVHTTPIVDADDGKNLTALEAEVMDTFKSIIDLQSEAEEQVRFSENLAAQFDATGVEQGGLWSLANVWLDLFSYQAQARQKNLEREIENRTKEFLDANPNTPFEQVLDSFRAELQKRFQEEVRTLLQHRAETAQLLLQSSSHEERLRVVQTDLSNEQGRLRALKAMQKAVAESL